MNINEQRWDKNLKLLARFYREKGRWPNTTEVYRGNQLGAWLARQRLLFLKGSLDRMKQRRLKEVGYDFKKTNFYDAKWEMYFECLKKYRVKHRKKWPSQTERFPKNVALGRWCYEQKRKYNEGLLTKKCIRQLKSINFPFKKIVSHDIKFEKQFERLKRYREKYPDRWPQVATQFPKGNSLGIWCIHIRTLHSSMPRERVKKLNSIGFEWDPKQAQWDQNYKYVQKYLKKNKYLPYFRTGSSKEELKAATWIHNRKTKLKQGKVPRKERLLLKKLGIQ